MRAIKKALSLGLAACVAAGGMPVWAQPVGIQKLSGEGGPIQESGSPRSDSGSSGAVPEEPGAAAEAAAAAPAAPSAVSGTQLGGASAEAVEAVTREAVSPLDTRVTVRVKEAPLATFLDTIAAQARVNFIITEGLERVKITAFLQTVKVREALQVLLEVKGLSYERVGKTNTFIIRARSAGAPRTVTRIYTLNYISLISLTGSGAAAITPDSGLSSGGSSPQNGTSQGTDSSGGIGAPSSQSQTASSGGGIGSGIPFIKVVESVLSRTGRVSLEPRTNSVIITDVPEVFPHIEQLIAELDKKVPQVMIEAQIVEINSDKVQDLGIEWGGANGELAQYVGPSRLTDYPLRPGILSGNNWQYFFPPAGTTVNTSLIQQAAGAAGATTATSGSSSGGGAITSISPFSSTGIQGDRGVFFGVFSLAQLTAILRALIQRSEARFLGKPKILTLNNNPAIIQVIRQAAIGQQTQTLGQGTASTSTSGVERRNIGLKLNVTPQVNREGYITMLVQPSFTDVQASAIGGNTVDPTSRGASTLVRVKNGQTIVLGGLLQSKENKVVRKVPLLGYIPVIGWLFTSVSNTRSNTDLVLFITPTIVND